MFIGKSTISMAMFNSYVSLPEGKEDLEHARRANLAKLRWDTPANVFSNKTGEGQFPISNGIWHALQATNLLD